MKEFFKELITYLICSIIAVAVMNLLFWLCGMKDPGQQALILGWFDMGLIISIIIDNEKNKI